MKTVTLILLLEETTMKNPSDSNGVAEGATAGAIEGATAGVTAGDLI